MQEWHPLSWSSALELQDILIPWSLPFWTISGSVEEKRNDKMSVNKCQECFFETSDTFMCQLWFNLQLLHPGMARLLRIVRLFRLVKIASRHESRKQCKFYSKFLNSTSKVRPLYELAQSITEALQGVGLQGMNCPNVSAIFTSRIIHFLTSFYIVFRDFAWWHGMGLSLVMCHQKILAPSPAQPSWSPGPASWLWRLHTWSVWALMQLPMLGFSQMVVVIRLSWQMWSLRTTNDWLLTIGQWQSQRGLLCSCMVLGNILAAISMWQTSL